MKINLHNRYLLMLYVIMINMITFSGLKAQAQANDKVAAKAFVQGFYDWYAPLYNAEKIGYPGALKQRPNYFSPKLLEAFKRDTEDRPAVSDDILGLDFDPFLGAQDIGVGHQLGQVKQVNNSFLIDLHIGSNKQSKSELLAVKTSIVVETQKINGQWKIINFDYVDTKYPIDLLTLFKNLHKERNVWLVKHHQKPNAN